MYYQLHDSQTEEILGTVKVLNEDECRKRNISSLNELWESWEDYNKLEEHDQDPESVDEFVVWHNDRYVTQIERIYLYFIQP